MHMHCMCILW